MAREYLKIFGRVQGVYFRQSAKIEADKLGLVGWVRNDPDGTVETLAVGPKKDLEKFIKWCKNGPESAKVENISVKWGEENQELASFDII